MWDTPSDLYRAFFSGDDLWWKEWHEAKSREPHEPRLMASLNTRGPALRGYACPECRYTVNSVATPWCSGGYGKVGEDFSVFGTRSRNISELYALAAYSVETGTPEAYAYHAKWVAGNGKR